MNRKQRRAGLKQTSPAGGEQSAAQVFADALRYQQDNKLDEAARAYKRVLLLKPDHAEACNNLAGVLQIQGKFGEASKYFARALELAPELSNQFSAILATLVTILPTLGELIQRVNKRWPERPPLHQLISDDAFHAIAADPLLLTILRSSPVLDVALEHALTVLRAGLLEIAASGASTEEPALAFSCSLARQCFVNEYVFATTPAEEAQVEQLKNNLGDLSPMQLAALAMYLPLHALPDAQVLLARAWPDDVDEVVTQQVREPEDERALRASIQQLTPIEDKISRRVREMYEENPYPRWVHVAIPGALVPIDIYLRGLFPSAAFTPLGKTEGLDLLVAGCGTGKQPIAATQLQGARILAIDLSLASLAYAKRKTPASLAARIDYRQADILKLATLNRTFDVIDAAGVLHHLADPFAGWRTLLALLRPNGFMHLGFYSEIARQDVVAARTLIAEWGYGTTAAEIRRCRQDLLGTALASLARFHDFFTTSECRDLLFHVQESRTTIPSVKAFLSEQGLKFIGFEFIQPVLRGYRALFVEQGWSMSDLDRWHEFEIKYPDTFSGMYQFWVQKTA